MAVPDKFTIQLIVVLIRNLAIPQGFLPPLGQRDLTIALLRNQIDALPE